jgi:methyl-accepting chemotaxis protein
MFRQVLYTLIRFSVSGARALANLPGDLASGKIKLSHIGYFLIFLTIIDFAAVLVSTRTLLQASGETARAAGETRKASVASEAASQETEDAWGDYINHTAKKRDALLNFIRALGYGGMVHEFKDYLITRSEDDAKAVTVAVKDVETALAAYRDAGTDHQEDASLDVIGKLADAYAAALDQARQMMKDGKSTEEINTALKLDLLDREALVRLGSLQKVLDGEQLDSGDRVNEAVTAIKDKVKEIKGTVTDIDGTVTAIDRTVLATTAMVGAISLLTMLTLGWFTLFRLGRPLRALENMMSALAAGDLSMEVPFVERGDEIGAMARTVAVFKQNSEDRARLASLTEEQRIAAEAARVVAAQEAAALGVALGEVATAVANSAGQLNSTSETLLTVADRGLDRCLAVGQASGEATSNVQAVASAAEELHHSIQEISRRVADASTVSARAADEARSTSGTITGLSAAAQKIGDVVRLINDIATQTNLLALNATIEAARAGDAGLGFAVVASEVKTLATQTARATEEIQAQIGNVQAETKNAVTAMSAIVGTISEVSEITTGIAAAVEQQGAATQEIARNVQAAAARTGELDVIVVDVREAAEDTRDQASQLRGAADELTGSAASLRDRVDAFVAKVRSEADSR